MKNISFKKILPHLIAIAIFLVVAAIISKPEFEPGTVLKQSDLIGWQGMSHQSFEYKELHGHFPLWVTSMFSGMPAYQIAIEGAWSPLGIIDHAFQLWLPQPMNFFFLACICFYFLCMCLKVRPFASILGSLGFAYCSFSAIIITAGHVTQMLALAYSPALIGAAILIYDKKYLTGFTLATLFTALQIGQGHQQVSYYLFLILGVMSVAYIIHLVKTKQVPHLVKSIGLLVAAGIIGVCINAVTLFPTYDYAKESKRGGQLVMDKNVKAGEKVVNGKTTGLSRDYAFQWSYGQGELLGMMYPGVVGYGNHYAERDGESYMFPKLGDNSHVVKYLTDKLNVPEASVDQAASQFSQSLYWGKQPFTNGPVYLGAVICFLFVFGMFYLDNKHKWWILAASAFAMLLALGHNLAGFNYLMFDYLPLYNKFRVPTMALVIPQILFPVIAALTLNKLMDNTDTESWKKFKMGSIATAALFAIAFLFYFSSDFSNENKQRTNEFNTLYNAQDPAIEQKLATYDAESDNRLYEGMVANFKGNPDAQKTSREFVSALKQDRSSLLLSDIIRSLIYVLIAAAFVALYLKKKLNATVLLIGLTLTALIDQMSFDMKYLNEKSFDSKEKYEEQEFPMTNADKQILQDKDPNYRVFNLSVGSPFEESKTSYYHKSIGGYHAAKLGIYDDLTAYQLSGQSPNMGVLDMLNTKYVIQRQGNDVVASRNPGALGNAWFVKSVEFVNGPVAEMQALTGFNPKDTVVVDEQYKNLVAGYAAADSNSTIQMKTFDNDDITYESSSTSANVAVFSEVYYKEWNAYIDGKKALYFKANYVLRAMLVPAGKHTIEFKFEPTLFYTSKNIANIFTWLLMVLLAYCIFAEVRKKQKEKMVTN
ncbi:MAG: YfhO family protein [Ferruginibacter sp.]